MRSPACAAGALILASWAPAQAASDTVERIVHEGRDKSQAYRILSSLSRDVGPRPTGSRNLVKALDWAEKEFRKAKVDSVWREEWGVVPETWHRGRRQSVRMVSPRIHEMVFTTPVLTHGTKGKVRGPLAILPKSLEEFEKVKDSLKGAFVLMPRPANMGGPIWTNRDPVDLKLDSAGIAGRVYGTPGDLVWTGGSWLRWNPQTRPTTPLIVVRRDDFLVATANVEKGRNPILEVDIENHIEAKSIPQVNLIAEIKGTEKPDEMVILCAHIDSWDGPGSTGASDNGTGTTTVIEAARILGAAKARPKRTIRFILWTGEEQGLLGATAYVEKHKDSLGKISALFNEDSGQNSHGVISALAPMKPILESAVAPLNQAFPDLPVEVRVVDRMRGGGSDHAPFVRAGVPGFFIGKRPGKPYNFIWHTQNDNLAQIEERWLRQMATHMALLAWGVGNAETLVPRDGLTPQAPGG